MFLENIKINGEFSTQDILNDKPLIDILINLSCSWKDSAKTRNTRNIVSEHIDKVDSLVKEMKLKVEECIKCNVKGDSMVIGMSYLKKAECVKNIFCTGTNFQTLLTDKKFLKTVKRLAERNEKASKANTTTEWSTICYKYTYLQWDSVIRTLIDYQNSRVITNTLSVEKLLEIGETILSNIVTSCSAIAIQTINEIQVSKFFLVIYIFKKGYGVLLNLEEFLYYPGALELLLSESKETVVDLECQQKNDEENMSQQQTGNKNDPNKRSYTG